jgi:hypothetical protein
MTDSSHNAVEFAIAKMLDAGDRVPTRADEFAVVEIVEVKRAGDQVAPRDARIRAYVAGMEAALAALFTSVVVGQNAQNALEVPTRLRAVLASKPAQFRIGARPESPLVVEGLVQFGPPEYALDCALSWTHSAFPVWAPRSFKTRSADRHQKYERPVTARLAAIDDSSVVTHLPFEECSPRKFEVAHEVVKSDVAMASLRRFFARVAEANA